MNIKEILREKAPTYALGLSCSYLAIRAVAYLSKLNTSIKENRRKSTEALNYIEKTKKRQGECERCGEEDEEICKLTNFSASGYPVFLLCRSCYWKFYGMRWETPEDENDE